MARAILVIEDEVVLAKNIKRFLERHGYAVRVAADGEAGVLAFESFKPDLVLLDLHLPGADGLQILARLRADDATVKVILMTAHGDVRVAVAAMKAGAYDYVGKPVVLGELKLLIDKAVGEERREEALSYYRAKAAAAGGLESLAGESPALLRLKQKIGQLLAAERQISDGAAPPVLIVGETGTGKELVARALHFDGLRRAQAFIEINCAAIPAHLIESELFGHERGAFTDARERKLGLAEAAHGGTLFLDEIGELDLAAQAKLLKLLEDKTVRRVGSVRDTRIDIRILAATNRSLDELVQAGRFRADLYYRLRVVSLVVPALRERGADIALLAERFLAEHGKRYGRPGVAFTAAARDALCRHAWPGNVRELRNVVEEAVLLSADGIIGPEHLSVTPGRIAPGGPAEATLAAVERELIVKALSESGGNVTLAAHALGITRDTLRYRLRRHGLTSGSSAPAVG